MTNLNEIFLNAYKKQLYNCRMTAMHEYKEAKKIGSNLFLHFRFELFVTTMNQITDELKKQLQIFQINYSESYLKAFQKELVLMYSWYILEIKNDNLIKEVNNNAIN